jgi:hypothetical protein
MKVFAERSSWTEQFGACEWLRFTFAIVWAPLSVRGNAGVLGMPVNPKHAAPGVPVKIGIALHKPVEPAPGGTTETMLV